MSRDYTATTHDASAADSAQAPLRWPPPGLEEMHAEIWPLITMLAVGGTLMTLPMLWSLAVQPFWSPGPFGGAWWLPSAATMIGLFLVLVAFARGIRLLIGAAGAARRGYDGFTVSYVVTDASRDAGFLLQGLRQYSVLGERERHWLLGARVVAAFAYATALLWVPVGFTLGLMLATRSVFRGVDTLWTFILGPAGLVLAVALVARAFDGVVTGRARMAWQKGGAGDKHVGREAAEWLHERAQRFGERYAFAGNVRAPRLAAVTLGVLAVLVPLPIVLLALLSTAGPVLTRVIGTTRFGVTAARVARTEILQPYALAHDSSISALAAGETLHALMYVGRAGTHRAPMERAPVRTYAENWGGSEQPQSMHAPGELPKRVFELRQPLTAEERAYIDRVASHPARAELVRLAHAPHADVAGGRWDGSAFEGRNYWDLPFPRFGQLREATYLHIATGVLQAERGDHNAAERTFREVVSVGLLLGRNGPTPIDVLLGSVIAQNGAHALRALYQSTGRVADAAAIRLALEGVDATEAATRSLQPARYDDGTLRGVVAIASNQDVPLGLRWESLHAAQIAGCINANAALFGQSASYYQWLTRTHDSLVRYPSEEALFKLALSDVVVPEGMRKTALLQRIVGATFGGRESAASCAALASMIAGL